MSKETRLIAVVVAVVVLIVGGLVLFGGGDDAEVTSSDSTGTSTSTSTSTVDSEPTTAAPTTNDESGPTTAAGSDTNPDSSDPQATAPEGPVQTVAPGTVSINDAATWQGGLTVDTVRTRFDAAESSDDLCTHLVALTSLPDLNTLPTLSADELTEYFTRWQALATETLPNTDGKVSERLRAAQAALLTIEQTADDNGGTFNEATVDQVLGGDGSELTQLVALFVVVGDECPAPPV